MVVAAHDAAKYDRGVDVALGVVVLIVIIETCYDLWIFDFV